MWLGVLGIAVLTALLTLLVVLGLAWRWKRRRFREMTEDVLKHVYSQRQWGRLASVESVAGQLGVGVPEASDLIVRMEQDGWIESSGGLQLTAGGERRARHMVRAHRLWETWLAYEAHLPLKHVHRRAEKDEHRLTEADVARLEAALGHPRTDPHGDPIPAAQGQPPVVDARPLSEWPLDVPARIVHVEDEPPGFYEEISRRNLNPGAVVRVLSRSGASCVVRTGDADHSLSPLVCGNIHVTAAPVELPCHTECVRLSDLHPGEKASVVEIGPQLQGLTRRRLLDLGLTPGATVQAYLQNPFGEPIAYRVRGTTVALRAEQAEHIWVRRLESPAKRRQTVEVEVTE